MTDTAGTPNGKVTDDIYVAKGITKRFGPVTALRGVDLHLGRGEILGVVGDNGAGKSTLVKILTGYQPPTDGQLFLEGEPVTFRSVRDARDHGIETIFQDLALVNELSVYHNLFLNRELTTARPVRFLSNRKMRAEARAYLDQIKINLPSVDVPVEKLSGGQRQAIAVARATRREDVKILLLDEPLSAMGAKEANQIIELVRRLSAERGVSMIIIDHNYSHIFELCDRVNVVQQGRVTLDKAVKETSVGELTEFMVRAYRDQLEEAHEGGVDMGAAADGTASGPRRLRAELLDPAGAQLGEGPAWDARLGQLVWVDIPAGHVHLSDGDGRPVAVVDVGTHVGAALPSAAGGWLLATRAGFALLDAASVDATSLAAAAGDAVTPVSLLDVHGDGDGDGGGLRFNDAKCDPQGRALAGTMRYDEGPGDGTLYRLDPGPVAVPLLQGQGLCNGLGWSPDGRTLYFVDSLTHRVAIYDYDLGAGALGAAGVLVELDPGLGLPDGLCVDDEGGVWVAFYGGAAVRRYRADGTLDTVVRVPVRYPTCVAFGGADRDRLFITTGGGGGPDGRPSRGDGGLWAVDPGVTGPPATPWEPVGPVA